MRAIGVPNAGVPLGYEVKRFGIPQTTTNQLDHRRSSQISELRHKLMITAFDYVINALGLKIY